MPADGGGVTRKATEQSCPVRVVNVGEVQQYSLELIREITPLDRRCRLVGHPIEATVPGCPFGEQPAFPNPATPPDDDECRRGSAGDPIETTAFLVAVYELHGVPNNRLCTPA